MREIAVTFDDLPFCSVVVEDVESHRRLTERLLAGLAEHGIRATGFVNAGAVQRSGAIERARVELLGSWLEAGHELANHTFAHRDLHAVPVASFEADIANGEPLVRELMAAHGRTLRWFRHPYLHTGTDLATRQRVERFVEGRGHRIAPVTVYAQDWIFAAALDRAREHGRAKAIAAIGDSYVPHLERQFEFFERLSVQVVGREIPQVLLLHANTINAERIDELGEMMRRRGYTFASLEKVLADPGYAGPDRYLGADSVGWLERLALARPDGDNLLADRPRTPRFVRVRAELGRMDRLRRALERRARAAVRSARQALRAIGVLPPKRRPA